ncbi:MAG: dienelactone hydrolase family protein [Planctomycetes bacterium]|nr:dienelactone hydrolase family protein [Planctomycetota bacterium]
MRIATTTLPTVVAVALITLTVHQGVADESGDKAGKPDRAAMRAKMLKRIDTNGDGKLSREELAKARSESAKRPGGAGKLENHRLEVVTFPQEVQDADSNMNKDALLYHPIKKSEGKIPLIVLLHGAGGTKQKDVSAFKGNRDVRWVLTPANSKYIAKILVPHSRSHWNPDALNKAVDHLLSTNDDIDKDRIYCIGYSLGGLGTWNWARHSPERLAAIVPVAFIANQSDLKKMVDLPIWAMVGTADRRRAGSIPSMEKALKELGSTVVKTTIFQGTNHGQSANRAWSQEGLLEWLFAQSRKK